MHTSQIDLVAFGPEHLEGAVALSRRAGWPHRPEDWQTALAVSRGIAAVADDHHVVGTVTSAHVGGGIAMRTGRTEAPARSPYKTYALANQAFG